VEKILDTKAGEMVFGEPGGVEKTWKKRRVSLVAPSVMVHNQQAGIYFKNQCNEKTACIVQT
jgi:hypothetical protein